MEEVAKETGHRPSVSMPSLDSTDEFPSQAAPTENASSSSAFVPLDSYVSTDTISTSEPCSASISEEIVDSISVETSQPLGELSTETLTEGNNEEDPKKPLIQNEPENTFVEDNQDEPSIDTATVEGLVTEAPTESLIDSQTEVLQGEELDETQVEEDPSIAIDQFIKKIADEQLSSKRIEERKEEEAQEQEEGEKSLNLEKVKEETEENLDRETCEKSATGLEESVTVNEEVPVLESTSTEQHDPAVDVDIHPEPTSVENTLKKETTHFENQNRLTEADKPESMEVDSDNHEVPTQNLDAIDEKMAESNIQEVVVEEEPMQMESIEEIQKEIDKIPSKSNLNNVDPPKNTECTSKKEKEETSITINNSVNNHVEEESIEQQKSGHILKNALEKEVKVPSIEDSAEVAKDAVLIERAQEEIRKLDVLVCGECHNTFYYIQDFSDHKKGKCPQSSILTSMCEAESKPQVWGFILWKVKHTMDMGDNNPPSSWSIYQRWCKLPQVDKNAWITAGQSIQFASKLGTAKVTEVRPAKPTQQSIVQKIVENSVPSMEFVDNNKENSSSVKMEHSASNIIKKGFTKPVKLNNDVTIMPSLKNASTNNELTSNTNTAVRTTKVVSMQKDEFVVEKIMAKRFNPRKKTWEYNIKWENFGHDADTWEPVNNLSHCKKLLEQFEDQLRRMKEEKVKQASQPVKGRGRPANPKPIKTSATNYIPIAPKTIATISNVVGGVSDDYVGGSSHRPQRHSKQKAMNQVKQWCGNISDDGDTAGAVGIKRKYETDDSDEDFDDKKIKLEDDSDYSDKDVKPKIPIKKAVTSTPKPTPSIKSVSVKNGSTTQQILPSNILIPDANGVVRINQKQLPALSSGVYIMSKTAGIIKLDSTTSKVATSGGQTIVKVAPKIGQTQIKIVKKDGNTTKQIIQVSPKPPVSSTPIKIAPAPPKPINNTQRFVPKIRKEVRKPPPLTEPAKFVPKKVEVEPPKKLEVESESDDGLEPLPFPDPDEPIPDLEENKEDDFVLDPFTGKIAGVEYVDKPVVIKEEPQPVPPTTNELENIVKMAAADLSDDDLQNSDSQDEPTIFPERREVPTIASKPEQRTVEMSTPGVRKVVKYSIAGQGVRTETLKQGQPKPIISTVSKPTPPQPRRVVQQKVINQMVSQRTPGQQTRTVVRHVIEPSRPGHGGGNINVIRKTVTSTPKSKFNLTPQKPLPSPLQPTRTYSAMGGIRQTSVAGSGSKVQVYSAKSNVSASQTASHVQREIRRIGNTVVRATSGGQITSVSRQQSAQQYATQKQPIARIVQRVATSPKKNLSPHVLSSNVSHAQPKQVTPAKPRTVISMPSLTEDDTPVSPPKLQQKVQAVASQPTPQKIAPKVATPVVKQEQPVLKVEEANAEDSNLQAETSEGGAGAENTDWSSFTMADGDNPIYVTGDDGTIYQVAGQNEQGQTILITQGADGQQQCLLVTNEIGEMAPDEPQPSTSTAHLNTDTETTTESEQIATLEEEGSELVVPTTIATSVEESLQTPLQIKTDGSEMEGIEEDGVQDQVVAQVVRAEPPSPGGTHKVVVMLPDGNLMVTQVSPEEYASLELD